MVGQRQYYYLMVEEERYLKEKSAWQVVLMLKEVDLVLSKGLMERVKGLYFLLKEVMKVLTSVIVSFVVV